MSRYQESEVRAHVKLPKLPVLAFTWFLEARVGNQLRVIIKQTVFFIPLILVVSTSSTTPKAQQHGLPITSKGCWHDSWYNLSKRKHPGDWNNVRQSKLLVIFSFSSPRGFRCFLLLLYQTWLWKSLHSSSLSSACHYFPTKSLFCQLHHAVAMMCLPHRPDNVVTSTNPTCCWTV